MPSCSGTIVPQESCRCLDVTTDNNVIIIPLAMERAHRHHTCNVGFKHMDLHLVVRCHCLCTEGPTSLSC